MRWSVQLQNCALCGFVISAITYQVRADEASFRLRGKMKSGEASRWLDKRIQTFISRPGF